MGVEHVDLVNAVQISMAYVLSQYKIMSIIISDNSFLYVKDIFGGDIPVFMKPVAYPGILFGGGGSTNSVEDRENGDLGAVAP